MARVRFHFVGVFVKYAGKGYVSSGSGVADASVEGYCHFYRGDEYCPDEEEVEATSIEIDSIEELDLDEVEFASSKACGKAGCEEAGQEDLDLICEDQDVTEDFCCWLADELTVDNCEFDEEDIYNILAEQDYEKAYDE